MGAGDYARHDAENPLGESRFCLSGEVLPSGRAMGKLRQPVFLGLREDKNPGEVRRE